MQPYTWKAKDKEKIKDTFRGWLDDSGVRYKTIYWRWKEYDDVNSEGGECQFTVYSDFPYADITLNCYPSCMKNRLDDDELEQSLVHEVIHCILRPMSKNRILADNLYRDYEEMVVEHFTEWIWRFDEKCKALAKKKGKQ